MKMIADHQFKMEWYLFSPVNKDRKSKRWKMVFVREGFIVKTMKNL